MLDDANVYKFAEYLKRYNETVYSHHSQEITMEAADIPYGVTMEEHGISR